MYYGNATVFVSTRRRIASWFGRREHFSGELLGIVLIVESYLYRSWRLYLPLAIWLVYFISHRLEKRVYGKVGFR